MVRPVSASTLVQFGVVDALLAGVCESTTTVADVRRAGDFGLGCGEGLGSEVVVLDGRVIEFTADAAPVPMRDDEIIPFAEVCRFDPAVATAELVALGGMSELRAAIESRLTSRNLFHGIRMHGDFATLRVRVPPPAARPFRPLAEVLHDQIETVLPAVRGTLIGFWGPSIYQGISVEGLHLHFLADDDLSGGHVLDVADAWGELRMTPLAGIDVRLPADEGFLASELTHEQDTRLGSLENASRND